MVISNDIDLSLLDPVLEKYQFEEGALIPILQETQQVYGYLPEEVLVRLSREARVPLSRIYAVVTFYSQFYLTPRGRNIIRVCRGTACHVRGSSYILRTLTNTLGINDGETTNDFQFSLETVACLGTCFLAPVMMVNRSYYGKLDPQKSKTIVESHAQSGKES
jgi:NADH-quinone oxidoreductase subunit E